MDWERYPRGLGYLAHRQGIMTLAPAAASILFAVAFVFTISRAQSLRGDLHGTVTDAGGGPVAGATILAQAQDFALIRTTTSDAAGEYEISDLPPATYRVSVSANGFEAANYVVKLLTRSASKIAIRLKRPGPASAKPVGGEKRVFLPAGYAATNARAPQDKALFSEGARSSAFEFEPPTSAPATDAAPTPAAKACAQCRAASCAISEKIKCLRPNLGERFLRGLQYQYQMTEQPRTVLVGSTPTPNPERYLWQQTLTFKFAELFPDRFLILKRTNDYLKNDLSRITGERVKIGCLWDRANPSEFNKHLVTCFSKGGNWIRRAAMGLSANVSLGERAAVQQGFVVTQPQFGKHSQFSGGFTFDPAKLVINASVWKSTFDDVFKMDPALAILGASDAITAMNDHVRPPWQPSWEVVFIPKVEFQRKSQFDFLKQNGELVEFQVPQRALNTLTLTWDFTRLVPDTKSRIDADAVMETLRDQVNGREAPKNTKFCIAMFGSHVRALAVSPLLSADSCWALVKVVKVTDGNNSYQPDHYELACGDDPKSCKDGKNGKNDKDGTNCSVRLTPIPINERPKNEDLPPEKSCKWTLRNQAP